MAEEATPKKKRGCLKLLLWGGGGLVGLFVVLAIVVTFWENGLKDGCNSGKAEDCETLLDGTAWVGEDFDLDQITNEEYKPKFAAKVEAAKKAATSSTTAVTEDKTHPDFQNNGLSDYDRCLKTRAQVNRELPGKGDELFKCEEIKSYLKPAERVKAAERQGLVQKCEQTIKAVLKDPRSYRFVGRQYIATENNGLDVRVTYSATNDIGGRIQQQKTCSYKF